MARATICDLEVGSSARNAGDWDALIAALNVASLGRNDGDARAAGSTSTQRLLAPRIRRGRKVPDLLIAATAEDLGLTVLHYDADFDLIGPLTGQPCQWVVPRGSAD
jgi:predicted nucleic acid-binding protein